MNRPVALFALAVFLGFIAILAYEVPSPDLIIVCIFTGLLVIYDVVTSSGDNRS